MMISTRGRYALRVMIDLALHSDGSFVPMKDVAKRQDISLKYIEKILPVLSKEKLVETVHGKGGGYRLSRASDDYTVGEILRLTEGDLAPVSCLCKDAEPCPRSAECKTLPMWKKFSEMTNAYFDGILLSDLMDTQQNGDYVI